MSTTPSATRNRRERERAQRHRLIIDAARELAESQGWDAVTVRKLADRIEYSQPVLYSHFAGKVEIVSAVAEEGCAELAASIRRARTQAPDAAAALAETARVYVEFATEKPAIYDAMFLMPTTLKFGPEAPQSLKDAFAEIFAAFAPFAGDNDAETYTEVGWSSLHGLATLERGLRLRPDTDSQSLRAERLALLVSQWVD